MKIVTDKIITETLPLASCRRGDDLEIDYSIKGSWMKVGRGELGMIKPLAKGGLQIKFTPRRGTVQKYELPSDLMVVRRRKATADDVPGKIAGGASQPRIEGTPHDEAAIVEVHTPDQVEILPPLPPRVEQGTSEEDIRFGRRVSGGSDIANALSSLLRGSTLASGGTTRLIGGDD